tara:strand:- start:11 stop:178 length:168 start_codon:yes stop_codon:yes gene_type:complete
MKYINYKFDNTTGIETLENAETMSEAKYLLNEYQISDKFGNYWISNKPCKNYNRI